MQRSNAPLGGQKVRSLVLSITPWASGSCVATLRVKDVSGEWHWDRRVHSWLLPLSLRDLEKKPSDQVLAIFLRELLVQVEDPAHDRA